MLSLIWKMLCRSIEEDDDDDDNNNNNNSNACCLPLTEFIALMLVELLLRKCLKQIILIKHNRVKNPNWPEANQLAFYKRGWGVVLGTTMNKSSWRSWVGIELRAFKLQVQRSNRSATLPPRICSTHWDLFNSSYLK